MKRVLVVSDTHGRADLLAIATLAETCDMILHLGDGWTDGQRLLLLQAKPVIQVTGNADLPLDVVPEKRLEIEGWPVLLTHGHLHGVKHGLMNLVGRADDLGCRWVLFGHVHRRLFEESGRVSAFCPSSAAYNYDQTPPAVGLLEFTPEGVKPAWIEVPARGTL